MASSSQRLFSLRQTVNLLNEDSKQDIESNPDDNEEDDQDKNQLLQTSHAESQLDDDASSSS